MMNDAMKEKLLEKILELFSGLPDKDDMGEGGLPKEGELPPKDGAELQVIGVDAGPMDKKKGII